MYVNKLCKNNNERRNLMASIEYSEAATEVLAILEHMDIKEVNKISKNFIKFLQANSSKTYKPQFNFKKPIKELQLKPKTEALIGIIYLKYWANKEEKEKFNKKIKENEEKYQKRLSEKYNVDNLFKDKKRK